MNIANVTVLPRSSLFETGTRPIRMNKTPGAPCEKESQPDYMLLSVLYNQVRTACSTSASLWNLIAINLTQTLIGEE